MISTRVSRKSSGSAAQEHRESCHEPRQRHRPRARLFRRRRLPCRSDAPRRHSEFEPGAGARERAAILSRRRDRAGADAARLYLPRARQSARAAGPGRPSASKIRTSSPRSSTATATPSAASTIYGGRDWRRGASWSRASASMAAAPPTIRASTASTSPRSRPCSPRRGALGFNCKILIEMGEEVGSAGLRELCAQHRGDLLQGRRADRLGRAAHRAGASRRSSSARAAAIRSISSSNCAKAPSLRQLGRRCSPIRRSFWRRRWPRSPTRAARSACRNGGRTCRNRCAMCSAASKSMAARTARTIDRDWGEPGLTPGRARVRLEQF